MVTYCCVNLCRNNTNTAKAGVSFHAFPTDPKLRQKLLQVIGRPSWWDPPDHIRVCSEHFKQYNLNEEVTVQVKEKECPTNTLPQPFDASHIEACRICLATDVKMISLKHGLLKTCWETLATINESLPQCVCSECGAQIIKYYRLVEKSMIVEATLQDIYNKNYKITTDLIRQTDRQLLNLQSTLGYLRPTSVITLMLLKHEGDDDVSGHRDYENDIKESGITDREEEGVSEIPGIRGIKRKSQILNETKPNDIEKKRKQDNNSRSLNSEVKDEENVDILHSNDENVSDNCNVHDLVNDLLKLESPACTVTVHSDAEGSRDSQDDAVKQSIIKPLSNLEEDDFENSIDAQYLESNEIGLEYSGTIDKTSVTTTETEIPHKNNNVVTFKIITNHKKRIARRKNKMAIREKAFERVKINDEKLKTCFNFVELSFQEQLDGWQHEIERAVLQKFPVKCEICSKRFLRKSKLFEKHLTRHNKLRGDHVCQVCHERYGSADTLDVHTTLVHLRRYECTKCPSKMFYSADSAQKHQIRVHSVDVYNCPYCPHASKNRSHAYLHRLRKHASDYHCRHCGRCFLSAHGLAVHAATTHAGQKDEPTGDFRCDECDVAFDTAGARRVHMLTYQHHRAPFCDKTSAVDESLRHLCLMCAATFPTERELSAHKQETHPRHVFKYIKPRSRDPTYPRKCDYCDVEMKSGQAYHWHMKRVHGLKLAPSFVCEICGKGFKSYYPLRDHLTSHGPAKHLCSSCPMRFQSPSALRWHMFTHAPHKMYRCPDCGKAFRSISNVNRHRQLHSDDTPHECIHCSKKFKRGEALKLHIKHVHDHVPWPVRVRNRSDTQKKTKHEEVDKSS